MRTDAFQRWVDEPGSSFGISSTGGYVSVTAKNEGGELVHSFQRAGLPEGHCDLTAAAIRNGFSLSDDGTIAYRGVRRTIRGTPMDAVDTGDELAVLEGFGAHEAADQTLKFVDKKRPYLTISEASLSAFNGQSIYWHRFGSNKDKLVARLVPQVLLKLPDGGRLSCTKSGCTYLAEDEEGVWEYNVSLERGPAANGFPPIESALEPSNDVGKVTFSVSAVRRIASLGRVSAKLEVKSGIVLVNGEPIEGARSADSRSFSGHFLPDTLDACWLGNTIPFVFCGEGRERAVAHSADKSVRTAFIFSTTPLVD